MARRKPSRRRRGTRDQHRNSDERHQVQDRTQAIHHRPEAVIVKDHVTPALPRERKPDRRAPARLASIHGIRRGEKQNPRVVEQRRTAWPPVVEQALADHPHEAGKHHRCEIAERTRVNMRHADVKTPRGCPNRASYRNACDDDQEAEQGDGGKLSGCRPMTRDRRGHHGRGKQQHAGRRHDAQNDRDSPHVPVHGPLDTVPNGKCSGPRCADR